MVPFFYCSQLNNISAVSKIDDPAALSVVYDTQSQKQLLTPEEAADYIREALASRNGPVILEK